MAEFKLVVKDSEISDVSGLAKVIWNEHYSSIITLGQIEYMTSNFQSFDAIKAQIENGYRYYLIQNDGRNIGYFAINKEADNSLFLSKLYIEKDSRGKGIGRRVFEFLENYCKENECVSLWLTVNVNNKNSIEAYKKFGMQVIRTQVVDIGEGYVMDDFVFEKRI